MTPGNRVSAHSKRAVNLTAALKDILGELPFTAEVYWYLQQGGDYYRPGKPLSADFSLHRIQKVLPAWRDVVLRRRSDVTANETTQSPSKILAFGTLRYWIEHVTLLGLALAGMGHQVTLSYLPYGRWQKPINRFNLRRQNLYAQAILHQAEPALQVLPLLSYGGNGRFSPHRRLPVELAQAAEQVALRDTQYTLQMEQVNLDSELYRLRLKRNREAARLAYAYLQANRPDLVLVPNGTIQEFGVIYQVARYLDIPTVTYEFGEQRGRIWLAKNAEVMRQDTNALWERRKDQKLDEDQWTQIRQLFASRQSASLWQNFALRWQGVPSEGGEKARAALGLDQAGKSPRRPVILLATNVIGDSLTLGRQVFSDSMTEWLERTIQFFAARPDVQFVIRIHPGELITKGPSVASIVHRLLPELPQHIHLVPADAKINTYDIVELTDLGLVYTTTAGLEMAMSGVPVIAVGNTHYRGKGFTLDPDTWQAYFELLGKVLDAPGEYRLSREQVELAWHYAYRFFFEYPHPFPWHLMHMSKDTEAWPLERVLSAEGQEQFGQTLRYLAGETVTW
jgi:hypothetical protein